MSTNRFYKLIAGTLVCSALCAASAFAEVNRPGAYQQLTAVEMAPGQTPQLASGFSSLSNSERAYGEHLPVQVRGPIKRIESVRYIPVRSNHKKAKTIRF